MHLACVMMTIPTRTYLDDGGQFIDGSFNASNVDIIDIIMIMTLYHKVISRTTGEWTGRCVNAPVIHVLFIPLGVISMLIQQKMLNS